eukprot:gene36495-27955_t
MCSNHDVLAALRNAPETFTVTVDGTEAAPRPMCGAWVTVRKRVNVTGWSVGGPLNVGQLGFVDKVNDGGDIGINVVGRNERVW